MKYACSVEHSSSHFRRRWQQRLAKSKLVSHKVLGKNKLESLICNVVLGLAALLTEHKCPISDAIRANKAVMQVRPPVRSNSRVLRPPSF